MLNIKLIKENSMFVDNTPYNFSINCLRDIDMNGVISVSENTYSVFIARLITETFNSEPCPYQISRL